MELEHAVTLGFLKPVPEDSVYALFPVEARRTIASTVVNAMLRMDPHPDTLTTESHMDAVGQSLGHAFSLPLEHLETVSMTLELYKLILLNARFQPRPVAENREKYVRMFMRHASAVFTPRAGDATAHATLCGKALEVFRAVGTQLSTELSTDTWEHLLKLVLAIADSLLAQPLGSVKVADQVQNQVLGLLYEMWFSSGTQSEELWEVWKSLMQKWRHRTSTIKTWNAVLIGLSYRLLGITYGGESGSRSVSFVVNHEAIDLNLDDDHVLYCWFKTLHLLGDLEKIAEPDVYHVAMHGLAQLTKMFTDVEAPLDGNSILHALGPHVLEAVTSFPPGRDMGKAVALDTVCKLFQSKAKSTRFHPSYLALYYNGLEQALRSQSQDLLSVVMLNSVHLLSAEFRGVRMLIPSLMMAVGRVLTHKGDFPSSRFSVTDLRSSSLRLLTQMLCLPGRFQETTFKVRDTTLPEHELEELPVIVTYADLNPHFEHIMSSCLECVPGLKPALLSAAFVYIMENMECAREFTELFVIGLLSNLSVGVWPDADMLAGFAFLVDLSSYARQCDHTLYAKIVGTMCSVVDKQKGHPALARGALHVIHRWLADGRWIYGEQHTLERVWRAIETCMGVASLKDAALFCQMKLMGNLGSLGHPERVDSTSSEVDALERLGMSIDDLYCFVFDHSLFSVIKHPSTHDNITVTVIVRNALGRFSWDAGVNYFSAGDVQPVAQYSCEPGGSLPHFPSTMGLSEGFLDLLAEQMPDGQHEAFAELCGEVEERHDAVHELRAGLQNTNVPLERPTFVSHVSVERPDTTPLRMFLTTLGFASLEAHQRLQWVPANSVPNFLEALDLLDSVPVRENYTVPVYYVPAEGFDEDFAGGSATFYEFARAVAWAPDLSLHQEWQPTLDAAKLGAGVRYFGDQDVELMMLFPSLAAGLSAEDKEPLFNRQLVRICWCEDVTTFVPRFGEKVLTLAIHPYPNGLFLVRYFRGSQPWDGVAPLLDGAIVSIKALVHAVRRAAINLSRLANKFLFGTALARRIKEMDVVLKSHASSKPFPVKFGRLFGTMREELA